MLSYLRSHMWLKLFLTYLGVILVCFIVLAVGVNLAAPQAFTRHMLAMEGVMGEHMGAGAMMRGQGGMGFFADFRAAVMEALTIAGLAAALVAALTSLLVARQVVAPLQAMQIASQRIAQGLYHERVKIPEKGNLDELGELAISFNRMAENLEQTESIRRQLLGDVAHELRTPLTAIKGSMEGLVDGVLPADAETYQQIYNEADRLNRLVDDLQELSRVEAGAYELNREAIQVSELVNASSTSLGRQYTEKGVSLEIDLPPGLPSVLADAYRMTQVMSNLLGNALQYTPPGGRVTLSARSQDNEVWVSVTDTGIGIPAEHLPHIFTRFYRVDKSRSRESGAGGRAGGGSGIGLTITKHLVEANGGKIWAQSPGMGQGSTFTFSLPAA
jgi:histidine kinase